MTKTYDPESYRAGLEAAAKVCDAEATIEQSTGWPLGSAQLAASIRNLPVPESKQPSVEDVARALQGAEGDFTLPLKAYFPMAKAAMRACGVKVEG